MDEREELFDRAGRLLNFANVMAGFALGSLRIAGEGSDEEVRERLADIIKLREKITGPGLTE